MINESLTFEFDEKLQLAFLTIGKLVRDKAAFSLPEGFGPSDVREALLATGLVRADGDSFQLVEYANARSLSEMLSAMLAQFAAPGEPSAELLEVQSTVEDYQSGEGTNLPVIPLMSLAWLDYMVREDIADEARCSDSVWSKNDFEVDCKSHRNRRMKELLKRYSEPSLTPLRRMTPSSTTYSPNQVTQTRTG